MHFREVNKKLKQLKTNVYWAFESLKDVPCNDPAYGPLTKDYQQAQQALTAFLNTPVSKLGK